MAGCIFCASSRFKFVGDGIEALLELVVFAGESVALGACAADVDYTEDAGGDDDEEDVWPRGAVCAGVEKSEERLEDEASAAGEVVEAPSEVGGGGEGDCLLCHCFEGLGGGVETPSHEE